MFFGSLRLWQYQLGVPLVPATVCSYAPPGGDEPCWCASPAIAAGAFVSRWIVMFPVVLLLTQRILVPCATFTVPIMFVGYTQFAPSSVRLTVNCLATFT